MKPALIVDTELATLRLCREVLEGLGFTVEIVDSGVAAVISARGRIPQVIVMGSQLRDVSAAEAIGWLRSNGALQSVPMIVIADGDGAKIQAAGVNALLRKPLSPASVERMLRGLHVAAPSSYSEC